MLLPGPERTPSWEPRCLASLGSLLDDQHWHHVVMVWRSSQLNLTVDKHTETVPVPPEFSRRSSLEVGLARSQRQPPPTWILTVCLVCVSAECRRDPGVSKTRPQLSWLSGKPAVQQAQPDRPRQAQGPPGLRGGEYNSGNSGFLHRQSSRGTVVLIKRVC